MLLVMDLGNTNSVLGVYDGQRLVAHWRLTTVRDRTVDEYGILARNLLSFASIDVKSIDGMIIASVVPPLDSVLEAMAITYFKVKPLFVDSTHVSLCPDRLGPSLLLQKTTPGGGLGVSRLFFTNHPEVKVA